MKRKLEQYRNCTPVAVASGSAAQMMHFVSDAKHDIAELARVNKSLLEQLKSVTGRLAWFGDAHRTEKPWLAPAEKLIADAEAMDI